MKFALRSRNVLTDNEIRSADVLIENGKISDILDYETAGEYVTEDYGDLTVMPSLIDTHVHVNEPGRADWEGFETLTRSAAAGGITMIADMPLNSSPVTTNKDSFDLKIRTAEGKLYTDAGFYGGAVSENISDLKLLYSCGVLGFKSFMIDSGLDEFKFVNENDLEKILFELKKFSEAPLLVHAEMSAGLEEIKNDNEYSYSSFLKSRPGAMECRAIQLLIRLSEKYDTHIHIVHLSSADAVDMIKKAREDGLKITVETCPHYLYFHSETIPDKNTGFKCTPPIRDKDNKEKLWKAVKDGVIDLIVSDHSPCPDEMKFTAEGNFKNAWGGISGIQLGLSAVWTEAEKRGFSIHYISKLMSAGPAKLIGMEKVKGKIEKGFDADIIIFDPDKTFTVSGKNLFHKNKLTPYEGEKLKGKVISTYLRGNKIYGNGTIIGNPIGKIILKETF
ncbi:MAG TPA: allantoinase AllB [Ignavibacteria bacterium]|nr:allantoinase AllB [Bacteroidota bacterium]HRI84349.1 allantoinase AllB [Ignavibacteria bacterium]HRJ98848.1 allantoinase AllB [Ignavibacteria bacterium]